MLKQEQTVIDGMTFTTTQFPAVPAFTLFARLTKSVGPALGVVFSADPKSEIAALAPALSSTLQNLDPDVVTALAIDVLKSTSVIVNTDGGAKNLTLNSHENINLAFMGRLPTMFRAIAFAVRVNFGDFFVGDVTGAPHLQTLSEQ
ncbi:MAG: phage tail assembly chaperone [Kofleriaceae bacterium]